MAQLVKSLEWSETFTLANNKAFIEIDHGINKTWITLKNGSAVFTMVLDKLKGNERQRAVRLKSKWIYFFK